MHARWLLLMVAGSACATAGDPVPDPGTQSTAQGLTLPTSWLTDVTVTSPAGDAARVFFPAPPAELRPYFDDAFPVVAVLPGGMVPAAQYASFARALSRYGFTVVVAEHLRALGPGAPPAPFPEGSMIADAIATAAALDSDPTSAAYRIIDTSMAGVTGHSVGGVVGLQMIGGSCAVPFCMQPTPLPDAVVAAAFYGTHMVSPPPEGLADTATHGVSVALLRGSEDGRSSMDNVARTYDTLDDYRALITIHGANHFSITDDAAPVGTQPDPTPATLDHDVARAEIARWTAIWLSSAMFLDRAADAWLGYGGTPSGTVTVDALD